MFPKILFAFAFSLFVNFLFAQQNQKADTSWYDYGSRMYNTTPCGGCPGKDEQSKQPQQFMENPYKYNEIKPIVVPDSLHNNNFLWLFRKDEVICL